MIDIRPFETLGHANHGWLNARHHFSFASYFNPQRMAWGRVRVWNDDTIAPQSGFPPHPHDNMEIVTFVRSGAITHRDSMGNEGRTGAGDVQVMSAGSGVRHAEYNMEDEATTLFQIWIESDERGGEPGWGQREFPRGDRAGKWTVVASGDPADDALPIRADAKVLAATLEAGQTLEGAPVPDRHQYLVPVGGSITLNGHEVPERAGVAITGESEMRITAGDADVELVMVDTR
jgi:redox-sensitive bicupin YhaK (pirin superfamily)